MKPHRPVYVLGGAHTPFIGKFHPDFIWKGHPEFGKRENPTIEQHLTRAVREALEHTRVPAEAIEKGVVGNFVAECFVNQGHLGAMAARIDPAFRGKPFHRVEGACASGGLAVLAGVEAIQSGYDVVLCAGAEVQTTMSAKDGADCLARAAHYQSERAIDPFTFPCLFARRTKIARQHLGITEADQARVVAKAYANAAKNPFAHMRTVTMPFERAATASDKNPLFLEHPEYREYLKVSDCSQVSDGASALVLVSEAGLRKVGRRHAHGTTELLAWGHACGPLGQVDDLTELGITRLAAAEAYRDAELTPADVGVAEVHDCFSVTEILMYEALGFARKGEGAALARDGTTTLGGRLPVNTGGGLMAFGHPVGATGVKQVIELQRQLTGQAGDYQVAAHPTVGLAANMGGDDRTSVVTCWRRAD
jgi:acetyl-CoA acyltransferase